MCTPPLSESAELTQGPSESIISLSCQLVLRSLSLERKPGLGNVNYRETVALNNVYFGAGSCSQLPTA
jgi:hypothetical protein